MFKGSSDSKEIVVIGGGLMGSAAAWHLSNQGKDVLLIEQQSPVYEFGSSYGEARIARSLGPENDIFSYLHDRSVSETNILIQFLNQSDTGNIHQMDEIYTTSPVTYLYDTTHEKTVRTLIQNQADPFKFAVSSKDAFQKFGMKVSESAVVLREFKPYSGTMNPKKLIKKLHAGVQFHGNEILYNLKVTGLRRRNGLFLIELINLKTGEQKSILSKKMVSAAGPYTGQLLKDIAPEFEWLITLKRVFLAYLKINPQIYRSLTEGQRKKIHDFYPVIDFTTELMFSMIEKKDENGIPIFKIGGHFIRKEITNLDHIWSKKLAEEEKQWATRQTWLYLNKLQIPVQQNDLQFKNGYSCVYSLTDSEIPLIVNIPDSQNQPDPNAVVLAGMSGVGAKGAMTYGLIGANLLTQTNEKSEIYRRTKKALGNRNSRFNAADSAFNNDDIDVKSWFIQSD